MTTRKQDVRRYIFLALTVVTFILLALQFSRFCLSQPALLNDLSGEWVYSLAPGEGTPHLSLRESIRLPGDLPRSARETFKNQVSYMREFVPHPRCFETQCSLIVGEFGGGAEVWLNGILVSERGEIKGRGHYEHHYAVSVELSRRDLRPGTNLLRLVSYSPKFELTGPRRPPVGIALSSDARAFERAKAFRTVFLNVGSAGIVALFGLVALSAGAVGYLNSSQLNRFVRTCLLSSLFLLSFSEIPREYLSLGFAISLHCALRYAMDWSAFDLVTNALAAPGWMKTCGHLTYLSIEITFFVLGIFELTQRQLPNGATVVSTAYGLIRFTGWSNCFAAFAAVGLLVRSNVPALRRWAVAGLAVLGCQVFDMCLFLGLTHGDYTSKYYLPALATTVFALLVKEGVEKQMQLRQEVDRQQALNQIASQMAHDICSPLAAMDTAVAHAASLPEDQRVMIRSAVNRTREIVYDFRSRSRHSGPQRGDVLLRPELLSLAIESIAIEKRHDLVTQNKPIDFSITQENFSLFSKVVPGDLKRMLSNLINNACEAMESGSVRIILSRNETQSRITISDEGKGIPEALIERVLQRGFSHGKKGGSGLGLTHAKSATEAWGGHLSIHSAINAGTSVSITLPSCAKPDWFSDRLRFGDGTAIVVLDDDISIHNVWKSKFKQVGHAGTFTSTHSGHEFKRVAEQSPHDTLFLIDYELVGESESGLDIVEKMGLAKRSFLVTSRHEEEGIQERCSRIGIKLFPKSLVAHIRMEKVNAASMNKVQSVLIDDDTLIHQAWKMSMGEKLACFVSLEDFLRHQQFISRSCVVYIDQCLGGSHLGSEVVPVVSRLGFETIFIATGLLPEHVGKIPNVTGIVGKSPPALC